MQKLVKVKNNVINTVIDYLKSKVKTDDQLRLGIENPDKTVEKLEKYIIFKAKKELDNRDGAIERDTVYGWAIHYFIESDKSINKEMQIEPEKEIKQPVPKKTEPKPKPKKAVEQLSFDLFGL